VTTKQLRPEGLTILREQLSANSYSVVRHVAQFRFMTGQQIEQLHFPPSSHDSAASAARAARRTLSLLARHRLLLRLQRRVGGSRAGSASFIYVLGPVGHRLLALESPRPRYREPSATFIDHTLGVAHLFVDLSVAERDGAFDVLAYQSEPSCWRQFSWRGSPATLRPDLYVALGVDEFEHRWFCEVDNGTEHLPAIIKKCRQYEAYYQSGKEQAAHGVFPRVCWLVLNEHRERTLRRAIKADTRLTPQLFVVAQRSTVIDMFRGAPS
jgi:hypothetical protein